MAKHVIQIKIGEKIPDEARFLCRELIRKPLEGSRYTHGLASESYSTETVFYYEVDDNNEDTDNGTK